MRKIFVLLFILCGYTSLYSADIKKKSDENYLYPGAKGDENDIKVYNYMEKHDPLPPQKGINTQNKGLFIYCSNTYPNWPGHSLIDSYTYPGSPDSFIIVAVICKLPEKLKTPANRKKLLKMNSQWMSKETVQHSIYVRGNTIWFNTRFCLTKKRGPVPIALINRTLLLNCISWEQYHKVLDKEFNISNKKSKPIK